MLPADGPLADDLAAAGIEVLVQPLAVLRRELLSAPGLSGLLAAALRDAVALRRLIRQRDVALVHSNTSVVLAGAAAARGAAVPHVWHVREIYSRFGRAWPLYRRVLASASALPCVSAAAAKQFRPTDPARVVHDGLAVQPVRVGREEARAALDLPVERPLVAVLGRISDWKGQDLMVRALAEPPLRERDVIGLLAGEAWPGAEDRLQRVLDLAVALGVRDRLWLLGFRDDVGAVYGAADVIAVPSTEPDPLPGAAIEAAAAGCAVVASDHGGLPEIIRADETGLLVAPRDATALANAIALLLDDPARRERLGAAAARDVRERFAPQLLLRELQALYDAVLVSR